MGRIQTSARVLGEKGEDATAAWYVKNGYRIVERNWSCREGELDIVAADDDVVVFCEVKSRASDRFADPALAVDHRKQQRVRTAALRWLGNRRVNRRLRFDVAIVLRGQVRIIEDAF
ncbi:MAG: YraN family protein [Actinomycetota bacterium]